MHKGAVLHFILMCKLFAELRALIELLNCHAIKGMRIQIQIQFVTDEIRSLKLMQQPVIMFIQFLMHAVKGTSAYFFPIFAFLPL